MAGKIYSVYADAPVKPQDLFGDGPIVFRDEQKKAIGDARKHFEKSDKRQQFLWNAKMRFGKTLCALELARQMSKEHRNNRLVKRVLIVTHRPVVNESWKEDFHKIFDGEAGRFKYGTKFEDDSTGDFFALERHANRAEENGYVFFASMQYLRRSGLVNDNGTSGADLDNEHLRNSILKNDWDLVVIDEAHEGTVTELGESVIKMLEKENTKLLHLSGTPFNLTERFKPGEIFNWDYVMEQQAKAEWDEKHPGEYNPYAVLPKMNIFTFDISNQIDSMDGAFSFKEFFRTWSGNPKKDGAIMPEGAKGRFIHESDVNKFLDLLCTEDENSNYPFSKDVYQENFNHTLWVVPGVKEAKALEQLLRNHDIFGNFEVINVAGNSDDDEKSDNALDKVKRTIGNLPAETATITISCGRLTTGTTVPAWTAVLYLKGSEGTSAATYMQTIFRVQSVDTETYEGMMKANCFVFDFYPARTLKMIAETSKYSAMSRARSQKITPKEDDEDKIDKEIMSDFIKLCPVISLKDSRMSPLDVREIYKQLENVFVDRLVRKGFDDPCLYNQAELNKIDPEIINHIGENGGQAPDEPRKDAKETVDLSHMTPEQREKWEEMLRKKKAAAAEKASKKAEKDKKFQEQWESWDDEQREKWLQEQAEKEARREKAKADREEFKKRITNIRGIALRIPLLMYGGADAGDTSEDITVENFTRKITPESWAEFMPRGVTKEDFNKIKNCFNATRFEEAGKRYRRMVEDADKMSVEERISVITGIFDSFHNPDKETILTRWRVVNMHMSDTLGGYCFFNERFDGPNQKMVEGTEDGSFDLVDTAEPRFVDRGEITKQLFGYADKNGKIDTKILEINSKSGLYPLYITYSLYRLALPEYIKRKCIDADSISVEEQQTVWDDVAANNVYVICNTPMAARITERTLFGFRDHANTISAKRHIKVEKLVEQATTNADELVKQLQRVGYWEGTDDETTMKFNAVVGNPPYQIKLEGTSDNPIYHIFMQIGYQLSDKASFITPARFLFNAGKTPTEWNNRMLNDPHFKVIWYKPNSGDLFPNVEIKGGVAVTYRDANSYFGKIGTYTVFEELNNILKKIVDKTVCTLDKIIYSQNKFALNNLYNDYPIMRTLIGSNGREKRLTTSIFSLSEIFKDCGDNEALRIIGLINNVRTFKYISRRYIEPHSNIDKYKVLIPYSNGSGEFGEVLSTPLIGMPSVGYTQSFIGFGAFDTEKEASFCLKYLKCKFTRALLGVLKVTQHNGKEVWTLIPIQNFSEQSDIDWSKSVAEIDKQLYAKYDLDESEIAFIESKIQPME